MARLKTIGIKVKRLSTNVQKLKPIERKRGRAGMRDRERVLKRDNYLCLHCLTKDVVTVATVVDHIVPLHLGGSDSDGNKQSLCAECHDVKSREEGEERTGGG